MKFTDGEVAVICRMIDSKFSERIQAYEKWANATNPHMMDICQRRYNKLCAEHELLRKILAEAHVDHPVGESDQPVGESDQPVGESDHPGDDTWFEFKLLLPPQMSESDQPVGESDHPVGESDHPVGESDHPGESDHLK